MTSPISRAQGPKLPTEKLPTAPTGDTQPVLGDREHGLLRLLCHQDGEG